MEFLNQTKAKIRMTMSKLFETKPVRTETLAEHLKLSRQKLNLDIKTVSLLTQIKPSYIESLESGGFALLPAEVYIKGFLKQMAGVYQVSEQSLIDQYEKERGFVLPQLQQNSQLPAKLTINPKVLVIGTAVLLAILVLAYLTHQIRSVLAAPVLEISEPASDLIVSGRNIVIAGKTEIGANVSINNQTVLVDKNGLFAENLILSPGLNVVEVKAQNKFAKESTVVRKINAEVEVTAPKTETALNVTLEIGPESAWIYLEGDGVVVHRGTMLAGSSKTVNAKKEILLTSANAGSTRVIYNGKDLGKLGRPGEVIRNVEFSASDVR